MWIYLERNKLIVEELQADVSSFQKWRELWRWSWTVWGIISHFWKITSDILWTDVHIAYKQKSSYDFSTHFPYDAGYIDYLYEYCSTLREMFPKFYCLVKDSKNNTLGVLMEDISEDGKFTFSPGRTNCLPMEWQYSIENYHWRMLSNEDNIIQDALQTNIFTRYDEATWWEIMKILDIDLMAINLWMNNHKFLMSLYKKVPNLDDHTIFLPQ